MTNATKKLDIVKETLLEFCVKLNVVLENYNNINVEKNYNNPKISLKGINNIYLTRYY